ADMDAALSLRRGNSLLRRCRLRARLVFRHRDAHPHAIAHHLDRALLGGMAVDLRVALIQTLARGLPRMCGPLLPEKAGARRAQLIALAGIAQVKLAYEPCRRGRHAFGLELLARLPLELAENALGVLRRHRVERPQFRADVVVHDVGAEQPERRE